MRLLVIRDEFGDNYTTGQLLVDGKFFCYTLEDTDRHLEDGGEKVFGKTAIPRGTYKVIVDFSGRFQRELPHILDVQGFTGVRIHSGNSDADTAGCLLVGSTRNGDWVSNSRATFNALFDKLDHAYDTEDEITIEIK